MKRIITAALLSTTIIANAQDAKECDGIKVVAEGKKTVTYLDDYDGITRNIYAAVKDDSVIYTVFRTDNSGAVTVMKKWHVAVRNIDFTTYSTGVFDWMNGNQKINKVTFNIADGQSYYFDELICGRGDGMRQITGAMPVEISFAEEAEAKSFFEQVRAVKAALPADGGMANVDDDGGDAQKGAVSIFNDSGSDLYLKQGSASVHIMKNETKKFSAVKVGDQIYRSDASGKKGALAFTVSSQMLKDGTIRFSTGAKK
ncbi:hypothetical protein CAP35_12305 [Chitinophagaceae bacterium IBVUCB1]|nr:hypothetical protein CAP35_12305 [Chitinophagaceae bacterium IBVUCB1]